MAASHRKIENPRNTMHLRKRLQSNMYLRKNVYPAGANPHQIHRFLIILFAFLMLFLVSCGQLSSTPSGHTASKQSQQTSNKTLTYVAIGASDTFGIGANDPYNENWAADLSQNLGPHVHLINLGIPGMTVHAALTAELPIALDSRPDLVTVWLAVNDIIADVPVDNYSHDLNTLLSRLQAGSPRVQIAVANVPDLTHLPYFAVYNLPLLSQEIRAYNAAIASIVQQQHAVLVDLSQFNPAAFPQDISGDGLHPSTVGYIRIAELFFQALKARGFLKDA